MLFLYVRMYVFRKYKYTMYVCTYVCMHQHLKYTYVCTVHMNVRMYVCMQYARIMLYVICNYVRFNSESGDSVWAEIQD